MNKSNSSKYKKPVDLFRSCALIVTALLAGCTGGAVVQESSVVSVSSPVALASSAAQLSSLPASSQVALPSSSAVVSSVPMVSSSSVASVPAHSSNLIVAVNAGGSALTYDGINFERDTYSRGGTTHSTTDPVAGTDEDSLFQSERYGQYTYEVPVSTASYDIDLFFNELYQSAAGGRIFSVSVEGKPVFTNFDLFAQVGADTAFSSGLRGVEVTDGNLSITLTASVDNGTLSGFAIYSDNGELQEPTFPLVEVTNPNIWADVPDMSIVRVDDTYYMSSTTMHMNPGVPIMKSTDLKNWEVINYAHKALDSGNNALNMAGGSAAYGKGTWASSINYKDGTFYVTSFSYTTNKTYIWKTNNIEGGSWTQTTLNSLYHDSSLLLDDDGRAYLAYGSDNVRLIELNADLSGIKSGGVNQSIIASASSPAGTNFILKAEGTQIQKINGWYYVSNICWPSQGGRTQIIHRSRNITGPYEGRIALQDQGVAQGEYVSTPEGDWYLYAFKDSGGVGRIPYLVPVSWQNNWPIVGVNGKVPATLGFNVEDRGLSGIIRSDEFSSTNLDIVWQWNHNPDNNGWSLSQKPGFMRITNTRVDSNVHNTRNTLSQRMFGPTSSAEVAMDLGGMKDGDTAGFAAFQDQYGFVAVKQTGNQRSVIMVNNNAKNHQVVENIPLSQNRIYLKVNGDFRSNPGKATFAYSLDGSNWKAIGNSVNTAYELTHFMGYRFALFNFGTKSTGGFVDFDYFRLVE